MFRRKSGGLSLSMVLIIGILCVVAGALGAGAIVVARYQDGFLRAARAEATIRGGEAVALVLRNAMMREWSSLDAVSKNVRINSSSGLQNFTDAVVASGGQIAWAGVADVHGWLLAGSHRVGEGRDVSDEDWFKAAITRPSLSDVHRHRFGDNPEPVLDMSRGIYDADGFLTGVVVYKLRLSWLQKMLVETSADLGLDSFLVTRSGEVPAQAALHSTAPPSSQAIATAARGISRDYGYSHQNGEELFNASVPGVFGEDLPLHWSLIVRSPAQISAAVPGMTATQTVLALIGIGLAMVLVLVLIIRRTTRPIEQLVASARKLAVGEIDYPLASRTSRDALELGAALAQLQTRLLRLRSAIGVRRSERATDQAAEEDLLAQWSRRPETEEQSDESWRNLAEGPKKDPRDAA
ncbi:cache and HAMP domain-containing protein [Frigidibacter sp. MR17.14]|uniref:cache domain-containing protein n=1 Tax=Frigidibacter sp. MR17.14 TaxID=3126509 RepID=UPI003012ABD7